MFQSPFPHSTSDFCHAQSMSKRIVLLALEMGCNVMFSNFAVVLSSLIENSTEDGRAKTRKKE